MSYDFSDLPSDWDNPDFNLKGTQVHEWKSYATDDVVTLWVTFSDDQKKSIACMLDGIASCEDWD